MNLKAIQVAGTIAKLLSELASADQLQVLHFLAGMTQKTEEPEPAPPAPKRAYRRRAAAAPPRVFAHEDKLLTYQQAADHLGVRLAAIWTNTSKGKLHPVKKDGRKWISLRELNASGIHPGKPRKNVPTSAPKSVRGAGALVEIDGVPHLSLRAAAEELGRAYVTFVRATREGDIPGRVQHEGMWYLPRTIVERLKEGKP